MTETVPPGSFPTELKDMHTEGELENQQSETVDVPLVNSNSTEDGNTQPSESTTDSGSKPDDATLTGTDKETSESSSNDFRDIAAKLYHEDFVLLNPAEYTQFLAAPDADSTQICEYYMDMFTWDASLVTSTRLLCSKLYLKGESQEIDRILLAFTKSYLKQHPDNVFCTKDFEKIYIVLYSLILLNTALHNNELNRKSKISQTDYIKNTLSTFLQQNRRALKTLSIKQRIQIERELNAYYEDLAHHELYLKQGDDAPAPAPVQSKRYSVAGTIRSVYLHAEDLSSLRVPTSPKGIQSLRVPHSPSTDGALNELSRQPSNGSIWSVDYENNRRVLLGVKRMVSGASSQMTATQGYPRPDNRFGFTRALASDASARAALRSQRLYDHMRIDSQNSRDVRSGHPLTRRSSRTSVATGAEDAVSVAADDSNIHALNVDMGMLQQYMLEDFDVEDFQDRFDLKLELQGAPYLKEGLLKLRILHNDLDDLAEQAVASLASLTTLTSKLGFMSFFSRSFAREQSATVGTSAPVFSSKFTDYFVVVSKGELRLYLFDPKLVKKQQARLKKLRRQDALLMYAPEAPSDLGDGNWLNSAAHVGDYNLCLTIAQMEKSAPHALPSKKVCWSLSFPKVTRKPAKKFIFEAGTAEVAHEFVSTCNFWASKITAIPTMEESVLLLEYGWTDLDALARMGEAFKKTKAISRWEQLPKGVYLSNYVTGDEDDALSHAGILKQFVQTLKYYNNLKGLYNNFNQGKIRFMKGFRKYAGSSNYKMISANYDARLAEYKAELSKYKSYLVLLAYGLKLRFDAEDEDKEDGWTEDLKTEHPDVLEERLDELLSEKRLADREEELELTKAVKIEIDKLIATLGEMQHMLMSDPKYAVLDLPRSDTQTDSISTLPSLVKSPKTFSLLNFKEIESSPINQLLSADGSHVATESDEGLHQAKKELIMSFSTNTIKEEDEPEDLED